MQEKCSLHFFLFLQELIFADPGKIRKIRTRKDFVPYVIRLGDGNKSSKSIEKLQEIVLYSLFSLSEFNNELLSADILV